MKPSLNNPITEIYVHHTAVSYRENPDQWLQTNEYHRQKWNFKSSLGFYGGYTYEISKEGKVYQARAEGEETAAVIGKNKNSVSICLDGNFDIEYPTIPQQKSLRTLLLDIMKRRNIPIKSVFPHRHACGIPPYKSCYGNLLSDTWAQVLVLNPSSSDILAGSSVGGPPKMIEKEAE